MKIAEKRLTFSIIMAVISTILVASLWPKPIILLTLFSLITIIDFITWRSKTDILFYIASATLGPIAEWIAIYYGAWSYTKPDLILIPTWLILCWGLWGIFMMRVYELIKKSIKE